MFTTTHQDKVRKAGTPLRYIYGMRTAGSIRFPQAFYAAALIPWFVILTACPFWSELPLSDPSAAHIDPELAGSWIPISEDSEGTFSVTFLPFDDREFAVIAKDGDTGEVDAYRAFATSIEGDRFLNLKELDEAVDKNDWNFALYVIEGDTLRLRIIDDALFKLKDMIDPKTGSARFSSSAELNEFVRLHLRDPVLYGKGDDDLTELTLKRAKSER